MSDRTDFEKALKQMDNWIKEPVAGKTVVYAGTLENTAGEIKLLNYAHLDDVPEWFSIAGFLSTSGGSETHAKRSFAYNNKPPMMDSKKRKMIFPAEKSPAAFSQMANP